MFRACDVVWSNVLGEGVVYMVGATGSHPVCVRFDECTYIQRYTPDGKWHEQDKEPEIFLKDVG